MQIDISSRIISMLRGFRASTISGAGSATSTPTGSSTRAAAGLARKRAHKGVYHKFSKKHLHRYVVQFVGKHNLRESDTIVQMGMVVSGLVGKRLLYQELIADNGKSSGARS